MKYKQVGLAMNFEVACHFWKSALPKKWAKMVQICLLPAENGSYPSKWWVWWVLAKAMITNLCDKWQCQHVVMVGDEDDIHCWQVYYANLYKQIQKNNKMNEADW